MNAFYFEELQLGFCGISDDGNDTHVGTIIHPPTLHNPHQRFLVYLVVSIYRYTSTNHMWKEGLGEDNQVT